MTASSWIASFSLHARHTSAERTMIEQLMAGMAGKEGRWGRPRHRKEKALWGPRCSSPSSTGFERGWECTILALPSPPTQGHYITGLEQLVEFIWAVQTGLTFHLCTQTHTGTQPEQRRSRLTSSALGPQISVRCGSQEPEGNQRVLQVPLWLPPPHAGSGPSGLSMFS